VHGLPCPGDLCLEQFLVVGLDDISIYQRKFDKLVLGFTLSIIIAGCGVIPQKSSDSIKNILLPNQVDKASITPTPSLTSAITTTPSATIHPTLTPFDLPTVSPTQPLSITPLSNNAPRLESNDVTFITNGSRDDPFVALTFDLCQKPELPAWFDVEIINVLIDSDTPATFFIGGDWARTHPEETIGLANNPLFEIGNHSWSHPDLIDLDEAQISDEIEKTQDILYQLTGQVPKLFRLPAGLYNDLVLIVIAWHGLYTIQWDVITADPVPDNTAENINEIVRENVQSGSIIIMHANGRGWHTAEALPTMIQYLEEQGYTLVTVSQLLDLNQ